MAFVVDTARGVVHREATVTPACALEAVPPEARQTKATELEATMVLKTRHYRACPHCWG